MKTIYKIILGLIVVWVTTYAIVQTMGTWMSFPLLVTGLVCIVMIVFYEEIRDNDNKSKS